MPGNMAMQNPHARIVGSESHYDMRLLRDGEGVPAHRVVEVPGRRGGGGASVSAWAPANYLDGVATCRFKLVPI